MTSPRNRFSRLLAVGAVVAVLIGLVVWLATRHGDKPTASTTSGNISASYTQSAPGSTTSRTATTSTTTGRSTSAGTTTRTLAARNTSRTTAGPVTGGTKTAAGGAIDPASRLPWINESALPQEALITTSLIHSGGPYPFPRNDNVTYHNNNRVLPTEPDGFYKEFTVITPGEATRGARRIISARDGAMYYTADHYATFARIRESR